MDYCRCYPTATLCLLVTTADCYYRAVVQLGRQRYSAAYHLPHGYVCTVHATSSPSLPRLPVGVAFPVATFITAFGHTLFLLPPYRLPGRRILRWSFYGLLLFFFYGWILAGQRILVGCSLQFLLITHALRYV